jgi:MOSC domain-containing protein YiiM
MTRQFEILSINISRRKGVQKKPVERAVLREGHGIVGDAHAGDWHRQVSLLADEDIGTLRGRGIEISHGDFAENITTRGIDVASLPVGARLSIGPAVLEITQIGKECHTGCAISRTTGDCVMPRKGVFARVLSGGEIDRESRCHYDL